jgi:hypothetical protein
MLRDKSKKEEHEAEFEERRIKISIQRLIRSRIISRGICGGRSGTRGVFLRVLPFPLAILIPQPTSPYSLITLASTLHCLDTWSVVK